MLPKPRANTPTASNLGRLRDWLTHRCSRISKYTTFPPANSQQGMGTDPRKDVIFLKTDMKTDGSLMEKIGFH